MSNRTIRINELVQREISEYLRKKYQSEATAITVTSVEVAEDLKTGKVFIGVLGSDDVAQDRLRWLRSHAEEIRREVSKKVILKWSPQWHYVLDDSGERGARILRVLDEIEHREASKPTPPPAGSV